RIYPPPILTPQPPHSSPTRRSSDLARAFAHEPHRKCGRRSEDHGRSGQGRNLDERSDRQAACGRREALFRCFQNPAGRRGENRGSARVSVNKQTCTLPEDLANAVAASLEDWRKNNKVTRLWQKDASLWTRSDESNWLGWLHIVEQQLKHAGAFKRIAEDVRKARFK